MAAVTDVLERAAANVVETLRDSPDPIEVRGAGTHADVGNPVAGERVHAVSIPAGIVRYEADDMTVTALAGTTVAELAATVGAAGQEVTLDPRSTDSTVGGVLAAGLSGLRRLRYGAVRDTVLEVRFVDGRGTLVKGGGPVVKNVTGYDVPRLLVGSLGTLGAIVQVTLRCRPRPVTRAWYRVECDDPEALRLALFRPSAVLFDGRTTSVMLEGHAADLADQVATAHLGDALDGADGADGADGSPALPDGPHRGRMSVPPNDAVTIGRELGTRVPGARWCAELGIGTVHVACDHEHELAAARTVATDHGGWMLREAGAPSLDGYGLELPNRDLMARVKRAFDPDDRFAPGRMPL